MKLAWLVWRDAEDVSLGVAPEFRTEEPPSWYFKVVPIVYAEIQK